MNQTTWPECVTPVSRQLPCPVCRPHEHHLLPCDVDGCKCHDAPIVGIT